MYDDQCVEINCENFHFVRHQFRNERKGKHEAKEFTPKKMTLNRLGLLHCCNVLNRQNQASQQHTAAINSTTRRSYNTVPIAVAIVRSQGID